MKFAVILLALTLPVLSFAESKKNYVCEVKSIRNSLIQKAYDYTIEIDYTIEEPSLDMPWLVLGDKFEASVDNSTIDMNFKVRENSCNGMISTIKSKRLYRDMPKNGKHILESKTAKFESNEQIDGTNVDLRIDGDKLSGKMRLMTSGEFSSEECGENVSANVILKFSCVKK